VVDITYIKVKGLYYYLALVCDAYSRKILGWNLAKKNTALSACLALKQAWESKVYPTKNIIHHSDRGIQYCCGDYRMLLYQLGFKVSTTETGDPRENAIAERIIGTLKKEYRINRNYQSEEYALLNIEHSIYLYNYHRINYSCDFNTPDSKHNSPLFSVNII
jgi:transposase InsO family protein